MLRHMEEESPKLGRAELAATRSTRLRGILATSEGQRTAACSRTWLASNKRM